MSPSAFEIRHFEIRIVFRDERLKYFLFRSTLYSEYHFPRVESKGSFLTLNSALKKGFKINLATVSTLKFLEKGKNMVGLREYAVERTDWSVA